VIACKVYVARQTHCKPFSSDQAYLYAMVVGIGDNYAIRTTDSNIMRMFQLTWARAKGTKFTDKSTYRSYIVLLVCD